MLYHLTDRFAFGCVRVDAVRAGVLLVKRTPGLVDYRIKNFISVAAAVLSSVLKRKRKKKMQLWIKMDRKVNIDGRFRRNCAIKWVKTVVKVNDVRKTVENKWNSRGNSQMKTIAWESWFCMQSGWKKKKFCQNVANSNCDVPEIVSILMDLQ